MLKRFLLYSFALYALVSCRNEDILERSSEQESDILYASAEQFDHSRTGLGSGNEVLWTKGDGISVFNHRSFNDEYLLKNGYEGCAAGEFKRVPSLIDDFQEIVPFSHCVLSVFVSTCLQYCGRRICSGRMGTASDPAMASGIFC